MTPTTKATHTCKFTQENPGIDDPCQYAPKATHTPGPWEVEPYIFQDEKRLRIRKDTEGLGSYIANICQEGTICEEHGGNPVANARLIAAAPTMLDALKYAIERYPKLVGSLVEHAINVAEGR